MPELMRIQDVSVKYPSATTRGVSDMLANAHFSRDKKDEIRSSYEKDKSLILGKTKEQLRTLVASVEANIQGMNHNRKENTGIAGGLGDALSDGIRLFGGKGYETGKDIYNQNLKQIQAQAKEFHAKILNECSARDFSMSEKAEIDALMERLEKIAGNKLAEVSWGKAVFNSADIDDIGGDAGTLKNRTKIFAKTVISVAEGAYDAVAFIVEGTGKALAMVSSYSFAPETRHLIEQDISEIFSMLTLLNAQKALVLLPEALEKFASATPDVQAEGFGKLFGGLLVTGGVGVKMLQGGKHATKLGYRAVRMAAHKGTLSAVPLGLAGALQVGAGTAAVSTGAALRVGEMDVIPGKKGGKLLAKDLQEGKRTLSNEEKKLREQMVRKNAAETDNLKRLADTENALRKKGLLSDTEALIKNGLIDTSGKLTARAQELILAGHNAGKPVYEQDFASIMVKARSSKGLPKSWKKELMDEGFMGSESLITSKSILAELGKTDRHLANQIESFLDSGRKIEFSQGAKDKNLGTRGDEWADKIISSTLVPLEKARGKMSPELFEQLRAEIYANLQKQLKENIIHRLNGHFEWIEQLGISECFDTLARHGFHMQASDFSPKEIGQKGKEAMDTLIFRAKISSAGINTIEKVTILRKEASLKRAELGKKLTAKDVSQDFLIKIHADIVAEAHSLAKKITDLKNLQKEIAGLKNINPQEIEAKKNIALAIQSLEEEMNVVNRFKSGPEITVASKKLETDKMERGIQEAKSARETASRTMNAEFENASQIEKAHILLKNNHFDISALNADRFFNLTFSELPDTIRKLFTPEIMARFGRDFNGKLTPESMELGVQFYGPKVLRKS